MSYIAEYRDKILSGEIIAGRYIHLELDRLSHDLADPDVKMDYNASNKRIQFIEHELRHGQAPFAGKPFKLELFQKAIIEAIFAPHIYDAELKRWVRKYQDVLLVEARKNGKTPLASAISLAEWVCGPMGGNILFGSNDFDQADLLFQSTNDMREESPKLVRCTHKNQKGIFWGNQKQKHARGKFSRQNKGTIKKLSARQSAKEGKNISIGVVDEVHEMQDNTLVMPIRQALSTQDEPLYIEITTEGFTDGGYLDERMALAKQVLTGEAEMPRWLIFLYQQDTEEEIFQDEQSWYKANPGMGTIKKWSFMRQMVDEARTNRKTRAFVLAKDFNIKQNTAAAWLESATIENPRTFAPEELDGQYYIGSLDFAETTDLCSAKALFVDPWTRQKKTLSMYFVPEIKAEALGTENGDALNPEQKDYREWAREGLVTICPGTEVDAKMVADWFLKLYDDYHVIPFKIGYDNWHAKDFKKYIGEYFGDEGRTLHGCVD